VDKDRETTMNCLAEFLNSKSSSIHTLKIAGQKGLEIGPYLTIFLKQIGENSSIVNLDISGNSSGDEGALALSKALQRNNILQHISFDKNGTTLRGIQYLKLGISKNSSLRYFETPLYDIGPVGSDSEVKNRFVTIWREIEELLRKRFTDISSLNVDNNSLERDPPSKPVPPVPEKSLKRSSVNNKEESLITTKSKRKSRSSKNSKDSTKQITTEQSLSKSVGSPTKSKVSRTETDTQPKSSSGVKGLAEIIGGTLGDMRAPHVAVQEQQNDQQDKSYIVEYDKTGIAYSAAPRLQNVKRARGPDKRPPRSGNIAGVIASEQQVVNK